MRLPSQRWLKTVFFATALVFFGVAAYLYGIRFFDWIESDASVSVLLAAKVLDAKLPVVSDWYYANSDIWVLAPHLFAVLPVALLGVGEPSLLIAVLLGLVVELFMLVKAFARVSGELWVGMFAAMVMMMAWSQSHVAFVYIQLAYGFLTTLYVLLFTAFSIVSTEPARLRRLAGASLFLSLIAVQNPTRGLVFVLAPLLVACVWPWRGFDLRRRLAVGAAATVGWIVAFLVYTLILQRVVSFSVPRGHIDFVVANAEGVQANLVMLGRGLAALCGGTDALTVQAVPGLVLMLGATALVCREVLSDRSITVLRFLGVIIVAQLAGSLLPLLAGNLLVSTASIRYLMPSLLAMYALAAIIAVRDAAAAGNRWWRRFSAAWLMLVPIAGLVAVLSIEPPEPEPYGWPDAAQIEDVADELARRKLTHGFAALINTNILNLEARGEATTCPVYFANVLVPQRWLADTSCYTFAALPERFFVLATHDPRDAAALGATLPAPIERFAVGPTYEVWVFRTADTRRDWLDLPLLDGADARFPMRFAMTHLRLSRGKVTIDEGRALATGEVGYVMFGPYMKLPKGAYNVLWYGTGMDTPGDITFIVAADVGKEEITRIGIAAKELPRERGLLIRVPFKLDRPRENVEFTVFSAGGARVTLDELVIEKRPPTKRRSR